ncbi:hypothetical protein [Vibrio agarivorans]|uniref:Transcriptional regulator n=1 Tax=Vibrio agarivorans TaxID=153622 RepID=A0ABT7Y0T7_9VIBR|nr:hypothetical protein [Vibrio agarivorans]MDN2481645.1 hypothetical protein [Vibrio agarivorans]
MNNIDLEQQEADLHFVAEAIADSFHLSPSIWLSRYVLKGSPVLPKENRHLFADFKETKAEMLERLND